MTNYEKYKEEIMKIAESATNFCEGFVVPKLLKPMKYDCDVIYCDTCHALFSVWLMDEYKEPEVDWSKVPVDTKIYVRDFDDREWEPRHFAKYKDGKVYAWSNAGTSWSCAENNLISWEYAKLAEEANND